MTDEELITACAVKVMGWEVRPVAMFGQSEDYWCTHADHPQPTGFQSSTVVHRLVSEYDPLSSDADACALLRRMTALEYKCILHSYPLMDSWGCWIATAHEIMESLAPKLRGESHEKEMGRAIVLAALKAIGVNA